MSGDLPISLTARMDASTGNHQRLRQAAAAFESFFVREILEGTEQKLFTDEDSDILGESKAVDQYRALLNDGLAERSAGGMGVADLIVNHLIASGAVRGGDVDRSGDSDA